MSTKKRVLNVSVKTNEQVVMLQRLNETEGKKQTLPV